LGNLKKSGSSSSVRELALSLGLPTARKRESMGICFIGKRRFPDFISEYLDKPPREGNFVCVDTGKIVGRHNGCELFTVGQGAKIAGAPHKWFVAAKDSNAGTVFVCLDTHHPALYSDVLHVERINWIGGEIPLPLMETGSMRAYCRTRHLHPLTTCEIVRNSNVPEYTIRFDRAVRAITPGQVAAIYLANGLICLGGGAILKSGLTYHERGLTLTPTPRIT